MLLFGRAMSTTVQGSGFESSQVQLNIVTGIYGSGDAMPQILVHDRHGNISWSWNATMGMALVPPKLRECIQDGPNATEAKFVGTRDGTGDENAIVAIIGRAAIVIGYHGEFDRRVLFAVCLSGLLANAHTVEMLPDELMAVATSGQTSNDGIYIYVWGDGVASDPRLIQTLPGVRAIHGMVWDRESQKLWAAGTTDAADGSGGIAYSVVQGYAYNYESRPASFSVSDTFKVAESRQLNEEWEGPASKWWDGAHDLVPVPNERVLLMPTDVDIYALHLDSGTFTHGEQVVRQYLQGFRPLGERTGYDGQDLPRSDIKSVSLHVNGSVLYTQAQWMDSSALTKQVNLLDAPSHNYSAFFYGKTIYRSRWISSAPGWP